MRVLRRKGLVFAILLAVVVPLTTAGCFGRFELTRKLYGFNRNLSSDRWIRWFGFLAMSIIPVYLVGGVIDLVLGNSLEFWGGQSPFASADPQTRYVYGAGGEWIAVTPVGPGEVSLVIPDASGTRSLRLAQESDSLVAYDADGRIVARVGDVYGAAAFLSRPAPAPR
ncbi:MAG: DUF3332 family protein [Deltaproteobacteria bacterium]|nr:DUF3332 family protein [Deltaproteobacteria bacterium]